MTTDGAYMQGYVDGLEKVNAISREDYETRLKADLVAMLTELKTEIENVEIFKNVIGWELTPKTLTNIKQDCIDIIQQKINIFKGE